MTEETAKPLWSIPGKIPSQLAVVSGEISIVIFAGFRDDAVIMLD